MKKLALLITTFVLSFSAMAADAPNEDLASCATFYEIAYDIMEMRQSGVPLPELLEMIPSAEPWISRAYAEPRFSSPAYQKRAAEDYAAEIYTECHKATVKR